MMIPALVLRKAPRASAAAVALVLLGTLAASAQEEVRPLAWQAGPMNAPIGGDLAEIEVPEGFLFLDKGETQRLMEFTQNPINGSEMGTVAPASDEESWFLVFEYEATGHVADDEREDLDAEAMLASVREGTEAANEERRRRGWSTLEIVGWHEEPHYDFSTNNLSWAIIGAADGQQNINRIIKLLGREGVMTATLVASPDELGVAVAAVDAMLGGYRYQPGNTYAEYVPGQDKLATYGLTALVVGGGAAALAKSGLLARMWKPIAALLVALGAGVKRLFFSGRSAKHDPEHPIG